jgi:glycosyltransferase involved in cell wall biosynthesis
MAEREGEHRVPSGTVAVLTFSRIVRDRRVLRQCALLDSMGFCPLVIAYGEPGDRIAFPLTQRPSPRPTTMHRLKTVALQVPAHAGARAARIGFWAEPSRRWALRQLLQAAPRLVIANDWPALVVATTYKQRVQVTGQSLPYVHYDTHEFATLEFDESAWWRFVYKPVVTHLESACIGQADSVSTVGPGLADSIQAHYRLAQRPAIVRNIPDSIRLPNSAETPWPLRILYHGQVLPDRGLEALLASVPYWLHAHHLTIRGDGAAGYLTRLQQTVARLGCSTSVTFEPAVKPDDVMPIAASSADLGVHFTPLDTDQRHFSLPNKLFEYIGAGLAVAVSPGADLKRIIQDHGVGIVSRDASAAAVAETINSLTREHVAAYKAHARIAAQTLCWDVEQRALRGVLQHPLLQLSTQLQR